MPIVGRICMNQLMIDITSIPKSHIGDIITMIAQDHHAKIKLEELADHAHTISNEILSRIGQRLPKIYNQKGNSNENIQTSILSKTQKIL